MDALLHWETLLDLLLGLSLSAACGFRVFAPLLAVSMAAVLGHVDFPANFDWAETDQALTVFAIATLIEVTGYYIPWFDHVLDIAATPAAVIAGTLITASAIPDMNPLVQWTLAIVAGGGAAGLTKGMTNILRIISTTISAGFANPVLATIELAIALTLAILAITAPIMAGVLTVCILAIAGRRLWKIFGQTAQADSPGAKSH